METLLGGGPCGTDEEADTGVVLVVGSWVLVTSASLPDCSGGDPTVPSSDGAVGTTDVDAGCGILTAFSTFVEGVAELVFCSGRGSQVDASISDDVVAVTPSVLLAVVEGGALHKAGVPVPDTACTGASIWTGVTEAGSVETVGDVFASTGDDGVVSAADDERVDAVDTSDMVGHGVEGVCDEFAGAGADVEVDPAEAVQGLVAVAVWETVGAQVTVAGGELDACPTEAVPLLSAAAQDSWVSVEGQKDVGEAGDTFGCEGWHFAGEGSSSPLSPGVEVLADGCGSDPSAVVTDDGMFVFDDKESVTVAADATGVDVDTVLGEDTGVDVVEAAGGAAVTVWVDPGRVFTFVEAFGVCSTGGEDSDIAGVDVTGESGGNAAASVGTVDVEAWSWSGAGSRTHGFVVIEEFPSDCSVRPWDKAGAGVEV